MAEKEIKAAGIPFCQPGRNSNSGKRGLKENPLSGWSGIVPVFLGLVILSINQVPRLLADDVRITLSNISPDKGLFLTPVWIGIHDGNFQSFQMGNSSSEALERLAEDGDTSRITQAFQDSDAGGLDQTVTSPGDIPPFAPGESRSILLDLDPTNAKHRFFSFLSMVIPSNDAFIGNENAGSYPLFDELGEFNPYEIIVRGTEVWDAGTEVNDEIPDNTAFLGQTVPDTGEHEFGKINRHPGLKAMGQGGILDDTRFSDGGVIGTSSPLLRIKIERPVRIQSIRLQESQIRLEWDGGFPPFHVQQRSALSGGAWASIGDSVSVSHATLNPSTGRMFFRVLSSDTVAPEPSARYSLTFEAEWSPLTHPTDFPGNPHFSGLIGATHNSGIQFWEPDGLATDGIEVMAETGGKSALSNEIQNAMAAGTAGNLISGGGIGRSPGQVRLEFEVSRAHPQITLVSMIAPSPDWFIGIHGLNLLENGKWIDELRVGFDPYDAGTDSGNSYRSANRDTSPQDPISRLTGFPLDVNGTVAPLGEFRFSRIE